MRRKNPNKCTHPTQLNHHTIVQCINCMPAEYLSGVEATLENALRMKSDWNIIVMPLVVRREERQRAWGIKQDGFADWSWIIAASSYYSYSNRCYKVWSGLRLALGVGICCRWFVMKCRVLVIYDSFPRGIWRVLNCSKREILYKWIVHMELGSERRGETYLPNEEYWLRGNWVAITYICLDLLPAFGLGLAYTAFWTWCTSQLVEMCCIVEDKHGRHTIAASVWLYRISGVLINVSKNEFRAYVAPESRVCIPI